MLTESEYYMAWLVYTLAAFGILAVVWRILGIVSVGLARRLTVGILFAIVLTPWSVSDELARLAPALFVGVFDATLQRDGAMFRAFFPLSISSLVVGLLIGAEHLLNKNRC